MKMSYVSSWRYSNFFRSLFFLLLIYYLCLPKAICFSNTMYMYVYMYVAITIKLGIFIYNICNMGRIQKLFNQKCCCMQRYSKATFFCLSLLIYNYCIYGLHLCTSSRTANQIVGEFLNIVSPISSTLHTAALIPELFSEAMSRRNCRHD